MRSACYSKIVIIVSVFLLGLILFRCFQDEKIFSKTLGRIAITYQNVSGKDSYRPFIDVVETNQSYTSLDEKNFIHWDVRFYHFMSEHCYGKDDTWPGAGTYAFSPLFPFLWRLSHLQAKFMVIVNYLLFAFSVLILSGLFLSPAVFGKSERAILFTLALTMPSVFSFYIPYCEATFIFTMSVALWGLFKNKLWVFLVFFTLCSLSRPSFLLIGLALITTDIYFLIIHKNFKLFIRELGIKILPVLLGMMITFFIQYLHSGSFFKMFEVHSMFWDHNFQYPKTITDWSTEGYGMNIFSIFSVVFPSALFLFVYLLKNYETTEIPPVSLFSAATREQYLFSFSIVYFIGNFLFVMLTQGGNLSGLHRYILVSPFFYLFLFILARKIRNISLLLRLGIVIPLVFMGYLLLVNGPYQHTLTFLDMGFFLLVSTMFYFILFDKLTLPLKFVLLSMLIFCNTVWLTYLFNHFLNNSYIIA